MVKILQFLNGKSAKAVSYSSYQSTLAYRAVGGGLKSVGVMMVFTTFTDGSSGAVLVAADRNVTHEEILHAHENLIQKKRRNNKPGDRLPVLQS